MGGPLLFDLRHASTEELTATLVARHALLDELVAAVQADPRRHWQLVGPRGSGKSHLVELCARRLAPRGWSIVRVPDDPDATGELAAALTSLAAAGRTPVLVLVDDLAAVCARRLRGRAAQRRLRQLLADPGFTLVAATTRDAGTGAPLAGCFETRTLAALSPDETVALVEARARWARDEPLLARALAVRQRVLALHHFTGGSPRLAVATYALLRTGLDDPLHTQLVRLLDGATPIYQAGPVEDRLFPLWRQTRTAPDAARHLRFLCDFFQRWYERRARAAPPTATALDVRRFAPPTVDAIRRLEGDASLCDLCLTMLDCWPVLADVPTDALALAVPLLCGSPAHAVVAIDPFLALVSRTGITPHGLSLFLLLSALPTGSAGSDRILGWLAAHVPAPELLAMFVDHAPLLDGTLLHATLRFAYRPLRDRGLLPPDLVPYATALAWIESPGDPSTLPPSLRDAVEHLLGPLEP